MRSPLKIGIAGTHSTGKSTFLASVRERLNSHPHRIGVIDDLATRARSIGFPILADHTYESTLWIMAEGLRQEAERTLDSDIILIDRPIFDALGYFEAALQVTGRMSDGLEELRDLARAHSKSYDLTIVTILDPNIPLGEGRDGNRIFREVAAKHIERLANEYLPHAWTMTSENREDIADRTLNFILSEWNIRC